MIFETLYTSAKRGELILINGGFCHWHLRRDGQLTIREIISIRPGVGSEILEILKQQLAKSIFVKCPTDLEVANSWYAKKGFELEGTKVTRSDRRLNYWRLIL